MEKVSIDKGEIGECCGEGVRGMWEGGAGRRWEEGCRKGGEGGEGGRVVGKSLWWREGWNKVFRFTVRTKHKGK